MKRVPHFAFSCNGATHSLSRHALTYDLNDGVAALVQEMEMVDSTDCNLPRRSESCEIAQSEAPAQQRKKRVPGRSAAGPTLPAAGLCLEHVEYDCPWAEEATW